MELLCLLWGHGNALAKSRQKHSSTFSPRAFSTKFFYAKYAIVSHYILLTAFIITPLSTTATVNVTTTRKAVDVTVMAPGGGPTTHTTYYYFCKIS